MLAVYDLSRGMASSMSEAILGMRIDGIWHTGVLAYNQEYYFGGGVQTSPIGAFAMQSSMMASHTLDMGTTTKTQQELESHLRSINHRFTQATYDLINNNCNNFADVVCQFLVGHGIPNHIVDLPRIVFATPGGAMLRPMIEGMQNNIRQQGTGMDPFGAHGAASSSSISSSNQFEVTLSNQLQSTMATTTTSHPAALVKAALEESPLISGDANTVGALGNRLLNLADSAGTKGAALTPEEKEIMNTTISQLQSFDGTNGTLFPLQAYQLLQRLILEYPSSHMSCLFLLRLMVLHDKTSAYEGLGILQEVVRRLAGGVDASEASTSFSTIPANVMALCSLSNLLSHDRGISYILYGNSNGSSSSSSGGGDNSNSDIVGTVLDVALRGLGHDRVEVRQMSCAMVYNLVLACTKEGGVSLLWKDEQAEGEVHSHAVQLLCGILEGLPTEVDAGVRQRKLAVVCRMIRAYQKLATDFIEDLGFTESFQILQQDQSIQPPLSRDERTIVNEIMYYCTK
jgi:hypothetical protein